MVSNGSNLCRIGSLKSLDDLRGLIRNSIPPLIKLLHNPNDLVRLRAANAISELASFRE